MKISIVIPNWNGIEKLPKSLPEVMKVKFVDEIVISDDGSTDGSVEYIKKNFPTIKLYQRSKNGGFSSNVNDGVKFASGDLIFLLNSDAIPEKNCLLSVFPHFEDPKVFGVGCNTGDSWSWAKFKRGYFRHFGVKGKVKKAHQTLWAGGGSSVFRKQIWDELGGLDQLFNPFYEEDLDIGYRATKRGYVNLFEPDSLVEHYKQSGVIKENFSESTIARIAQRNQLIFIWKNITSEKLIAEHKQALMQKLFTNPSYWRIFLSAFSKIGPIKQKRLVEKQQQKISDEQIFAMFESD